MHPALASLLPGSIASGKPATPLFFVFRIFSCTLLPSEAEYPGDKEKDVAYETSFSFNDKRKPRPVSNRLTGRDSFKCVALVLFLRQKSPGMPFKSTPPSKKNHLKLPVCFNSCMYCCLYRPKQSIPLVFASVYHKTGHVNATPVFLNHSICSPDSFGA